MCAWVKKQIDEEQHATQAAKQTNHPTSRHSDLLQVLCTTDIVVTVLKELDRL